MWNGPKHHILAVAAVFQPGAPSVVQLYDMTNDRIIKTVPDSIKGRAVTWKPDGEQVAFVGSRGTITVYTKNGEHFKTLSFTNSRSLFEIDWHPHKNILLAVEDDIFLIDIDKDSLMATYDDGSVNKGILTCQWHPSGEFFVTGDYGHENEGAEPSYLKYWRNDGSLIKRIKESKFEYRNVRWSKDGKKLAASADVLLILNEEGRLLRKTKFDANNIWGVGWNSKDEKIISSDQVGNVRITNTRGKILKAFVQ